VLQRRLPRGKPDFGGAEALEVQYDAVKEALSADLSQVDPAFRSWWRAAGRTEAEIRGKKRGGGEER